MSTSLLFSFVRGGGLCKPEVAGVQSNKSRYKEKRDNSIWRDGLEVHSPHSSSLDALDIPMDFIKVGSGRRSERTCCGVFLIQAALTMTSEREEKGRNGLRETGVRRGPVL